MTSEQRTQQPLLHKPTGRWAIVIHADDLLASAPASLGQRYVLFIASERTTCTSEISEARNWIDAGASYMCAWGPASSELDDIFDYAGFLPECGEPLPLTLMTTWHDEATLAEALHCTFYFAQDPQFAEAMNRVVILVDSLSLALRCEAWIRSH